MIPAWRRRILDVYQVSLLARFVLVAVLLLLAATDTLPLLVAGALWIVVEVGIALWFKPVLVNAVNEESGVAGYELTGEKRMVAAWVPHLDGRGRFRCHGRPSRRVVRELRVVREDE